MLQHSLQSKQKQITAMPGSDFTATIDNRDYMKIMSALSDLSSLEKDAVIAKGISEGLSIIVKAGKTNLRSSGTHLNNVYTGRRAGKTTHLVNSFKTLTNKKQLKGYGGFKRPDGAAAHLIDRGTKVRMTKKDANRGKVTGNLFWTKAVRQNSEKAQNELMESVRKSIENIMKRNSR